MRNRRLAIVLGVYSLMVACAKEVPPRTVVEFLEDPILLEATMVRCGMNRSSTKYEVECVNAREAINRIAKADEEANRERLEAQSERKRRALRRTQEAAAGARRRAADAARLRKEREYLGNFDAGPLDQGAVSGTVIPVDSGADVATTQTLEPNDQQVVTPVPSSENDLNSIREELVRRQTDSTN